MNNIIEIQKKIIPQAIELMEKRYAVLRQISISQPIGRRMLANVLNLSERTTRTEVDFLKSQNMIDIAVSGMTITDEGRKVLEGLELVDRKSTRLNSSHANISYAVFCLTTKAILYPLLAFFQPQALSKPF